MTPAQLVLLQLLAELAQVTPGYRALPEEERLRQAIWAALEAVRSGIAGTPGTPNVQPPGPWCGPVMLPLVLTSRQAPGGIARALALTPERRKEIAQHAAAARWGKRDA